MAPKEFGQFKQTSANNMEAGLEIPRNSSDDEDDLESSRENSSSGGHSRSSHQTITDTGSRVAGETASAEECSVTKQRTRHVNRSKALVYLSLLLAAVTVGSLTYIFTKKQEEHQFNVTFTQYAESAHAIVQANTANLFGQIQLLSVTLTSQALNQGAFPKVAIRRFDRRSNDARKLSGAGLIFYAPIIKQSQLQLWEAYAYKEQHWVYDDWSFHAGEPLFENNPGNITPMVYPYETLQEMLASDPTWKVRDSDLGELDLGPSSPYVDEPFHVPVWQTGPVPNNASIVNFDLYTHPEFKSVIDNALEVKHKILSGLADLRMLTHFTNHGRTNSKTPSSFLVYPIYEDYFPDSQVVALIFAKIQWQTFFSNVLPLGIEGILIEVQGSCGDSFSFMLNGPKSTYLGSGSYHDPQFDDRKFVYEFAREAQFDGANRTSQRGHCDYTMSVYPTVSFEQTFYSNKPAVYCTLVVTVFMFTTLIFMVYDYTIYRRQEKLLFTAQRSKEIVSSLFPKEVHDRIMQDAQDEGKTGTRPFVFAQKAQIKEYLGDENKKGLSGDSIFKTKPIADLFPEVTVMFADLVGFTAWSSMREPVQVFNLLETIYHEFDQIAKHRRVFKVETIGDCYVAVCGLPEKNPSHAMIMCRFARDCLQKMNGLTRSLEMSLGPDTIDLGLRIGLHSGPVTAGVLRGERARFQLFGDTVNTTARIEATGAKNRIHLSPETAELLQSTGKGHWIRLREDKVAANGKGDLKTYWLEIAGQKALSQSSGGESSEKTESIADEQDKEPQSVVDLSKLTGDIKDHVEEKAHPLSEKNMRLVNWNVEILSRLLREHVARRQAMGTRPDGLGTMRAIELCKLEDDGIPINEVRGIIKLPPFDAMAAKRQKSACDIDLGDAVHSQLVDYVQTIAALYRDNPFHNFEHASHVTMSVVKLLSRIVAPDIESESHDAAQKDLHDHTFGITSDALTQFACVLAALVHDVDHTGVPNSQLINEHASIAVVYKKKSVAEQNSFDIAWEVLMQDCFEDLRRVIYSTSEEFRRFRQLLINAVMATDIMDKDLNAARKARWNVAFDEASVSGLSRQGILDRKATIVIEHLIQASDVAHTMQHWHIYRKWNERLFQELYRAYKDGRSQIDPSENWYKGELGFFDYYIIPLAIKLKNCGVFGVSSDEYLNYAQLNRREWEAKGQEIVAEMLETVKGKSWL